MPLPDDGPAAPQVGVVTDGGSVADANGDGIVGHQGDIPLADADGGGPVGHTDGDRPAHV